ncbi:MAG: TerD family protein [Oscillospiraceae bacterium]|nr:TerD family protein [Oscillospiraceae bacterium]
MKLQIPQKTAAALRKATLKQPPRVQSAYTKQSVAQLNNRRTQQQQPVPPQFQQQQRPAQPQPVPPQYQQPQRPAPQPVPPQYQQPQRPAQPQPVPPQYQQPQRPAPQPAPAPAAPATPRMTIPELPNLLRRGQKAPLSGASRLKMCFGWNVSNSQCDLDASAFLVTGNGKVQSDDWFVFYSQETSPDGSVHFMIDSTHKDREVIEVDLNRVSPQVEKIVFVLTINEAFEHHLNFSMIQDPYVRILNAANNQVILSYRMEELYANVISMTIGELYRHNGQWKFNPVGNGVNQDLAGQCAVYGVEIN